MNIPVSIKYHDKRNWRFSNNHYPFVKNIIKLFETIIISYARNDKTVIKNK